LIYAPRLSLPLFHRLTGHKVILVGEGEAGAAKRRLLERAGAEVVGADDRSARLAFVALNEPEELAAELRARGLLVNVTDRPELCDFTVPSVLERGAVVIAVGTGGVSAGLAKALRLRLDLLLPASLGQLAEALSAARAAIRQRWTDSGARRRALDVALSQGGALDPFCAESAGRVAEWLAHGSAPGGGLVEFSLTSDDPDDLTLRQARWLGMADRVIHAATVPPAILARARADAARLILGKGNPIADNGGLTVIIHRGRSQ